MSKFGKFDYSEIKKVADNLKKAVDGRVIDKLVEEFVTEMAFRALGKIKDRTPVGVYSNQVNFVTEKGIKVSFTTKTARTGGNLKRNWQVGSVEKKGNNFIVEIFNNTEYAEWVNNGHSIKNREGKRIGKVEGKFMVEISMREVDKELQKFWEKRQKDFFDSIFNS